ncbi:MAG: thiamine-phosphate kinase [Sedimentisphaerales bacterium]|nr:thiamine-phosphate kinase [Sedimentisphaerales bacterium]
MTNQKSEFKLIEWISQHRRPSPPSVEVDIGDDMAVLAPTNQRVLVTTDMLLEGVHFDLARATLQQVGYKAMACSLSDCAAMAVKPWAAVVAVSLPHKMTMEQAQQLHQGLEKAAQRYDCPLVGGDTTSWSHPLTITVTMLARATDTPPVLRSGAQLGDAVFVTGSLGGSLQGRHLEFTPRLKESQLLAQDYQVHAMIDISDGLAGDLPHICNQSHVTAAINAAAIPISPAAQVDDNPLEAALTDGEDFELLFTLSPQQADKLEKDWPQQSLAPITRIGVITAPTSPDSPLVTIHYENRTSEPLKLKGWQHFHE